MRIELNSHIKFRPVGQGLFSTGHVAINDGRKFHWIFDCGTVSSQILLTEEISRHIESISENRPKIDLVAISHFDKDHISGLILLLSKCAVGVLLLPYMPLWRRLYLAIELKLGARNLAFKFLLDPVGFLRQGDFSIDKIVLVPGSDLTTREEQNERPSNDNPNRPENLDYTVIAAELLTPGERLDLKGKDKSAPENGAEMLEKNGCIRIGLVWEFVPYNDTFARREPPKQFCRAVEQQRRELLWKPTKKNLDELKQIYDKHFGKGGVNRNIISLFLYAGAIGQSPIVHSHVYCEMRTNNKRSRDFRCYPTSNYLGSILYTGDGFLDTAASADRLRDYFGTDRLGVPFLLQVMHHGSAKNWYQGVAKLLSPWCSVFSSDPDKGNKHPDAEVVRDFLPFEPRQVNKDIGFSIDQYLVFL